MLIKEDAAETTAIEEGEAAEAAAEAGEVERDKNVIHKCFDYSSAFFFKNFT